MNLQLRSQILKEIGFSAVDIEGGTINLESVLSFSLHFSEDNSHALATLNYSVKSQEQPEKLSLSLTLLGRYDASDVQSEDDKKLAYIKAYELLFPYAQNFVAEIFVKAGLPPFMLEMSQLSVENVQ